MDRSEANQVVQDFMGHNCNSYKFDEKTKKIDCLVDAVINESCQRVAFPKEESRALEDYYGWEEDNSSLNYRKVCDRFREYSLNIALKKITHVELEQSNPFFFSPFKDPNDYFVWVYQGESGVAFFPVKSYFDHHKFADALYTLSKEEEK